MSNPVSGSWSLVDTSGRLIILVIVLMLVAGLAASLLGNARYARMQRRISARGADRLLDRVLREARQLATAGGAPINVQALIENAFQSELRGLLLAERFVRASPGLMIILGLIGTFYGLTSSIGKLVQLVSADGAGAADIGQALTQGLSQALSGMAVAFTTSLFGIVSALVMMLLGVFSSLADRRTAVMVQLESVIDGMLAEQAAPARPLEANLDHALSSFGDAIRRLEDVVGRFDGALQTFSATTRDFREFNLHLKDNVQRMSLSFGDFGEVLKAEVRSLRAPRDR